MNGVRIYTHHLVKPNQIIIMADYDHPEIHMFEDPVPDGRLIYCNPVDEQRVRDAVAMAQERPKWWEDMRRFEEFLARL
jgi:hypothetical protein